MRSNLRNTTRTSSSSATLQNSPEIGEGNDGNTPTPQDEGCQTHATAMDTAGKVDGMLNSFRISFLDLLFH